MVSPLNYQDKKKMLFDCLASAEKSIKGTVLEQKESQSDNRETRVSSKVVSRRFQGKESIFKRPAAPIGKCLKPRRAPDYQVNPHKWKKYSLSDAEISDRSNTSAAFAFLNEIEKRKEHTSGGSDDDEMESSSQKITFKRKNPNRTMPTFNQSVPLRVNIEKTDESVPGEKPILKGTKVVMPEYVIGQKVKEKRPRKSATPSKTRIIEPKVKNSLQLQHLFEEDEDSD